MCDGEQYRDGERVRECRNERGIDGQKDREKDGVTVSTMIAWVPAQAEDMHMTPTASFVFKITALLLNSSLLFTLSPFFHSLSF